MTSLASRLRDRPARATLRLVERAKRPFDRNTTHLLIACAPKSGSTLLIETLLETTGFTRRNPLAAGDRQENDLYEPAMIDAMGENTVAQVHTIGSAHNLELIERYGHVPILLNRNLADSIVSLREHMVREGRLWPMVWADDRFLDMDDEEQLDLVIEQAAPWFVRYHVSWSEAAQTLETAPLWFNYDELIADLERVVAEICDRCDLGIDRDRIAQAIATVTAERETRLNVGRGGRGAEIFTDAQLSKIDAMTSRYPWIDWALVWD